MEYASKGVANAGLATGIIGSALGLLNGGAFGNYWGNGNRMADNGNCMAGVCSENMPVDLVNLIDTDRLTGNVTDTDFVGAVAELLKGGFGQIKSLLKEIFPEVTDDELKHTKMKDVMLILVDVVKYGFAEMAGAGNPKN